MQSSTYNVDAAFLRLVGTSGECRRLALIETFTRQERSHESVGGADKKIVERLIDSGLIISTTVTGVRGNQPHLLSLAPKGKEVYRLIFEENPLAAYDHYIAVHKSPEQIYLMLQACDVLAEAGFKVDRFPRSEMREDHKVFAPDLRAYRGAEELFIEIETDAYKNEPQRDAKWRTIAAGTNGHIYVIAQNVSTARLVRSEILQKRYDRPVTVGVVSLSELSEAVQQGAALWGELRTVT
jgi:hypothetical protein